MNGRDPNFGRPEVLVCYDFQSWISNEKKDIMFAIEPELFSIGTITIPTSF